MVGSRREDPSNVVKKVPQFTKITFKNGISSLPICTLPIRLKIQNFNFSCRPLASGSLLPRHCSVYLPCRGTVKTKVLGVSAPTVIPQKIDSDSLTVRGENALTVCSFKLD